VCVHVLCVTMTGKPCGKDYTERERASLRARGIDEDDLIYIYTDGVFILKDFSSINGTLKW